MYKYNLKMSETIEFSQKNAIMHRLTFLIQDSISQETQEERISSGILVFKYIIDYFSVISHPSFNPGGSLLNIIIFKLREFRLELVRLMDINFGQGLFNDNYKKLLDCMDILENLFKSIDIHIEPIEVSFENTVTEAIMRAPEPYLSIRQSF